MKPERSNDKRNEASEQPQWYVMRDLKRANAKLPAYRQLQSECFEVFTPMKWRLTTIGGKQYREKVPYIRDLLFVHAKTSDLDIVVEKTPTLQYRFVKGKAYREAMTVGETEMNTFIRAVSSGEALHYYMPNEITSSMYGKRVRIIGGELNRYEGYLLKTQGSKKKRVIVELPSLLIAAIEVTPDFIEILNESGTESIVKI